MINLRKGWKKITLFLFSIIVILTPICGAVSTIDFNDRNNQINRIKVSNKNPTDFSGFLAQNNQGKFYKFSDMFIIGKGEQVKKDREAAQKHFYLLFDLIASIINLGKNKLVRNDLYLWNTTYAKNNIEKTSVNLITPKLEYDDGNFYIWNDIYLKQDKQFRLYNDTLNIESGTLLYRTKISSAFYEMINNVSYPRLLKTLEQKINNELIKLNPSINDSMQFLVRSLIMAFVEFAIRPIFPPITEPIYKALESVLSNWKVNLKAAIFCLILSIVKIYSFIPYTTYALDYYMRVEFHANNNISQYIKLKNDYVDNIKSDAVQKSSKIMEKFYSLETAFPSIGKPEYGNDNDISDADKEIANNFIDNINKLFEKIFSIIIKPLINDVIKPKIMKHVIDFFSQVNETITDLLRPITTGFLLPLFYFLFNSLYKLKPVNEFVNTLIKLLKEMINIVEFADNVKDKINEIIKKIKDAYENFIKNFNEIKEKIKEFWEKIKDLFSKQRILMWGFYG